MANVRTDDYQSSPSQPPLADDHQDQPEPSCQGELPQDGREDHQLHELPQDGQDVQADDSEEVPAAEATSPADDEAKAAPSIALEGAGAKGGALVVQGTASNVSLYGARDGPYGKSLQLSAE